MKISASLIVLLGTIVEHRAMLSTKAEPMGGDSPRSLQTSLPSDRAEPPTGIVIVSQGRSGSTLMGALFRQQKVRSSSRPPSELDCFTGQFGNGTLVR